MLISKFGGINIVEKLKAYEEKLGEAFPEQLKDFLIKYNGGETPETSFNCNGISSDIRAFYGLGEVVYPFDDLYITKESKYLPFACDSFGNELLINLSSGEVYFMNHENECANKLANDLKSFINCCESNRIVPSKIKTIEEREQQLIKNGHGAVINETLKAMWQAEIDKYNTITQEKIDF